MCQIVERKYTVVDVYPFWTYTQGIVLEHTQQVWLKPINYTVKVNLNITGFKNILLLVLYQVKTILALFPILIPWFHCIFETSNHVFSNVNISAALAVHDFVSSSNRFTF